MDDDDADYMQGSDDEVYAQRLLRLPLINTTVYQDYGFDYSDDGDGDEGESADVENMYYTAKCTLISLRCRRILISTDSEEGR
jgi:COP9 signalosome complex subunit 2